MGFTTAMTRSMHGREIGMQLMSSSVSGGGNGIIPYLVGTMGGFREAIEPGTTARNLVPHGITQAATGSSAVHIIDPPVPGIRKVLYSSGGSTSYFRTANGETLHSSRGSSFNTIRFQQIGVVELIGLNTAAYLVRGAIDSTAVAALTTST